MATATPHISAPSLMDILRGVKRTGTTLGSALREAGRGAGQAYTEAVKVVPKEMGSLSRVSHGVGEAVPRAMSHFYQQGGTRALANLGLLGLTAYGGKKLYDVARQKYDQVRQPRHVNPYAHTF